MNKIKIDHPMILEGLSKAFVGDNTEIPFPVRSGSKLVSFFNFLGYQDKYGPGFPTKWKYAQDRIQDLLQNNRILEFFNRAISPEELKMLTQDPEINLYELQHELVTSINREILKPTEFELVLKDGKVILNRKEDVEPIGVGSFAKVYPLNIDGTQFAIKKLKEEHLQNREVTHRFKREYELMVKFNGSNHTISVSRYDPKEHSFVMEYAQQTLREFIEHNFHTMNTSYKESITGEIIKGMMELHLHIEPVIHRDLSYNNVLMVNNVPKLADFGLGKDLSKEYSYKTITEAGVGTAHFTDPIQLRDIKDACQQTDIYSLGKIIDFVFSGSVVSKKHKYTSLVMKATHSDLEMRYKSIKELHVAFEIIKKEEQDFDPVTEIINMHKEQRMVSEKLVQYFIAKDGGNTLFRLIGHSRPATIEALEIFGSQFEYELETLLNDMFNELKDTPLNKYDYYDDYAYVAMQLLKDNIGSIAVQEILGEILLYVAISVNRFSIQRLLEREKNNMKIPYQIRLKWM